MPLSEHEQRMLEQLEQALAAEDPKFASSMEGSRRGGPTRLRWIIGVVGVLAGLGLVLVGAGAAVLVLERDDHARARGVIPYAELAGGACGADAYHMTDLNPDPAGLAHVIGQALGQARVAPEAIDHVNVHGTATRGGYFPGVDTFLGLQIAAQEIADDLARRGFCGRLGPIRSTSQWLRWARNKAV